MTYDEIVVKRVDISAQICAAMLRSDTWSGVVTEMVTKRNPNIAEMSDSDSLGAIISVFSEFSQRMARQILKDSGEK